MNRRQLKNNEMLHATHNFCTLHMELLPPNSPLRQLFDRLTTVIDQLAEQHGLQLTRLGVAKDRTDKKQTAIKALRADLLLVSMAAGVVARTKPGFEDAFKLPKSRGLEALLYTAGQFAQRALESPDDFGRYGVTASFIEELSAKARLVEEAVQGRSVARSQHRNATTGLADLIPEGRAVVDEMDVIFSNLLRNTSLLSTWKDARRVKGLPRKKKKAAAAGNSES